MEKVPRVRVVFVVSRRKVVRKRGAGVVGGRGQGGRGVVRARGRRAKRGREGSFILGLVRLSRVVVREWRGGVETVGFNFRRGCGKGGGFIGF